MIIDDEFTVAADIDTVWRHLLDVERVAGCLPGAVVTATGEENTYDGTMRLKLGPMTVEYHGTATLKDIDEQAHTAVIELRAREAKGQGTASATILNRLEQLNGGSTVVRAQTQLNITGPQAQFGRAVIEDVGARVMKEFSSRLERQIAAAGGTGAAGATRDGDAPPAPLESGRSEADDALDVGALMGRSLARRAGAVAGALLLVVLLLRRRRR